MNDAKKLARNKNWIIDTRPPARRVTPETMKRELKGKASHNSSLRLHNYEFVWLLPIVMLHF